MNAFDFREYVFEPFVKHVESYAIKLPIGFPSLISRFFINKKHYIMSTED